MLWPGWSALIYNSAVQRTGKRKKNSPAGAGLSHNRHRKRLCDNFLDSVGMFHTNKLLVESSVEERQSVRIKTKLI